MEVQKVDYREALAAAYGAERDRFHRFAASALISAGYHDPVLSAEDVVNQAILSLLDHPVEHVENYAALITTAIRKRAIDMSRSASRTTHRETVDYVLRQTDSADQYSQIEDAIDASLAVQQIQVAWLHLGDREREVFTAVAIRSEAQTDVGARMGLSKQRIGQIYKSAISSLREAATEGEGGHGLGQ